jgi:hypothetical protein
LLLLLPLNVSADFAADPTIMEEGMELLHKLQLLLLLLLQMLCWVVTLVLLPLQPVVAQNLLLT